MIVTRKTPLKIVAIQNTGNNLQEFKDATVGEFEFWIENGIMFFNDANIVKWSIPKKYWLILEKGNFSETLSASVIPDAMFKEHYIPIGE